MNFAVKPQAVKVQAVKVVVRLYVLVGPAVNVAKMEQARQGAADCVVSTPDDPRDIRRRMRLVWVQELADGSSMILHGQVRPGGVVSGSPCGPVHHSPCSCALQPLRQIGLK